MARNAFYAQSGGVTAVINASAAGVIETARKHRKHIGRVYAGRNGILGAFDSLIAIDAGGHQQWRVTAHKAGWSGSPAVSGGVVYDNDGDTLRAVDATNGAVLWSFPGSGFWSAPVVWNGLAIAGTTDGKLTALNAASGTLAWQITLAATIEVIAAGGVLYGGAGQTLYAIDALNGRILWTFDVQSEAAAGAAIGDGTLFITTKSRGVHAVD